MQSCGGALLTMTYRACGSVHLRWLTLSMHCQRAMWGISYPRVMRMVNIWFLMNGVLSWPTAVVHLVCTSPLYAGCATVCR